MDTYEYSKMKKSNEKHLLRHTVLYKCFYFSDSYNYKSSSMSLFEKKASKSAIAPRESVCLPPLSDICRG